MNVLDSLSVLQTVGATSRASYSIKSPLYSSSRACDTSGDRSGLYVYAREVKVLVRIRITIAWQLKDTQVPVGPV